MGINGNGPKKPELVMRSGFVGYSAILNVEIRLPGPNLVESIDDLGARKIVICKSPLLGHKNYLAT